jgi:hypothetical protein
MAELHPLADRYLDALYELPADLKARRDLEDEIAAHLTGGEHACLRGFWKAGTTILLKGVLHRACERSGGTAFVLDVAELLGGEAIAKDSETLLQRVATKVNEFVARVGAPELKADPKQPLTILGELAAPIFIGVDNVVALGAIGLEGAAHALETLLSTPKNVRVAVVCHRHRALDALFDEKVVERPGVVTALVGPISDEELVHAIQTPAIELGVTFENEALGTLAELAGNRPWELFIFAALAASRLAPDFKGSIGPDRIEELLNLDVLGADEAGQELLETYVRILTLGLTEQERKVLDMLAGGAEGEASEGALELLIAYGWVRAEAEGYEINGSLMAFVTQAVLEGLIKVS